MYKLVLKAGNITREIQRDVLFNENGCRFHKIKETIIHLSLENAVHHAKVVAESWGGSSHGSVLVKEAIGNEKIVSQINF